MICCCALAGTAACKNCNRRAEFEYPQYIVDYAKTNPIYLYESSTRITALEHAIRILNERIEKVEEENKRLLSKIDADYNIPPLSDDFPDDPREGDYFVFGERIYKYIDNVWEQLR